ncbi:MAG: hypothetical protein IJP48_02330 [Synergistaceae bacterium]|nr:hypothetical protein [Synergistaceae bacterium]
MSTGTIEKEKYYNVQGAQETHEYVTHDEVVKMTAHFIGKHREALEVLASA